MRKKYDFYAYNTPTSGKYFANGAEYFCGEDFRSAKRYKEYKNCGFNVLLLQHENSYSGEDFESSECNKCMTEAYKAGVKKIIVSDSRIKDLCIEENLVGDNGRFKTLNELKECLTEYINPYKNKGGFYGLQLFDEPRWFHIKSYGLVYRTLKEIMPAIYLQCNLNPLAEADILAEKSTDVFDAYEQYLNFFLDETGADSITFDEYPFRRNYIICGYSLRTYQIASKVCKERNVELHAVFQSFSCMHKGRLVHRRITEKDMYWQINLGLGFGCREFSFFTYFTKQTVELDGGVSTDGVDGAALVNRDGSRTVLYYVVKKIIKELKAFAPVALTHRFKDFYLSFGGNVKNTDLMQTEFALRGEKLPYDFKISDGALLVTRSVGEQSELYMAENINNVKDEIFNGKKYELKVELPLGTEIWYKGRMLCLTQNKEFVSELKTGEALFFKIIKKKDIFYESGRVK